MALTQEMANEIASNFQNEFADFQTGNYNSPQNFADNQNDQRSKAKVGVREKLEMNRTN